MEAVWYPETTNDYLHEDSLYHMTVDYRDTPEASRQDVPHFYDAQSRPAKVSYNGIIYTYITYIHNLQGDVVGLLDDSGALVVEYRYDAWGTAISTTGSLAATLGKRNPFRYRGYVNDVETLVGDIDMTINVRLQRNCVDWFLNLQRFDWHRVAWIDHYKD